MVAAYFGITGEAKEPAAPENQDFSHLLALGEFTPGAVLP